MGLEHRRTRPRRLTVEIEFTDDSEAEVLLKTIADASPGLMMERKMEHGLATLNSKCVYVVNWDTGRIEGDKIIYKSDFS